MCQSESATRNREIHDTHRKLHRVGGRWQSGVGERWDVVRLFSRFNNTVLKVALPIGGDESTETTYPDGLCKFARKLAKAIREEDIPRYRIRDESAKGRAGQDEPRQAIYYQIPYERARKAICFFWGSAEFVTRSRKLLKLAEAYEQIAPVRSAVKQRYPHSHSIYRILAKQAR